MLHNYLIMLDIFEAARANDYQTVAHFIRQCGNSVDEKNDIGLTCLHISATWGNFETAQVLLECGADFTLKDTESNWLPLHRAIYFGHVKVAMLLLTAGALMEVPEDRSSNNPLLSKQTWLRDKDGMTPMDLLTYKLHLQKEAFHSSSVADLSSAIPFPAFRRTGSIFTFGKADVTLGIHLPKASDIIRPRRIEAFADLSIDRICTGNYHCLATTSEGHIYSWGHGRGGKLGHGMDEGMVPEPIQIKSLCAQKIIRISLSDHHSMAVTNEGVLYSWGSNRFGQLGHADLDTTKHLLTPRRLDFFRRDYILGISCGEIHSICYTDSGELYSWGGNKHGQLGLKMGEVGATPNGPGNLTPKKVSFPIKLNSTEVMTTRNESVAYLVDVVAAYHSTLVLVKVRNQTQNPTVFHNHQQRLPHGFLTEVYQWGDGVPHPRKVHFQTKAASKRAKSVDLSTSNSDYLLSNNASTTSLKRQSSSDPDERGILQHFCEFGSSEHTQLVQICAGRHHFAALSIDGIVYTWGIHTDVLGHDRNDCSVLNNNNSQLFTAPQIVEALLPDCSFDFPDSSPSSSSFYHSKVVSLAATGDRTAAVTNRGEVFVWGASSQRGVLSPDSAQTYQLIPRKMVGVKRVEQVSLAEDYTMLVVNIAVPSMPDSSTICSPLVVNNFVTKEHARITNEVEENNNIDIVEEGDDASEVHSEADDFENERYIDENKNQINSNFKKDVPRSDAISTNHIRSLQETCQLVACQYISMKNVLQAMAFAEKYHAKAIHQWCIWLIARNFDYLLTYVKPSDIEKAVHDWKLPSSSFTASSSAMTISPNITTPVKSSLTKSPKSEAFGPTSAQIRSSTNKSAQPVLDFSQPDVLARALKGKHAELELVSSVEDLQKLMRSTKKKLFAIQELQEKVKQEGYLLSREQEEKVHRKLLLQAEYALMEQFLVRLTVREKHRQSQLQEQQQHNPILASNSPPPPRPSPQQQNLPTAVVADACTVSNSAAAPALTTPVKTAWKNDANVNEKGITLSSAMTSTGRTVLSPPVTPTSSTAVTTTTTNTARSSSAISAPADAVFPSLSKPTDINNSNAPQSVELGRATVVVTPKKTASSSKSKYVPFNLHTSPSAPATPSTSKSSFASSSAASTPAVVVQSTSVWAMKSPLPIVSAVSPILSTTTSVSTPVQAAATPQPAVSSAKIASTSSTSTTTGTESASFGTSFNFEAALAAKRQLKTSKATLSSPSTANTALITPTTTSATTSNKPAAWGSSPKPLLPAASSDSTSQSKGASQKPPLSLAEIVAEEEEAARMQAQYYASLHRPGTTYIPNNTSIIKSSQNGQDAWYVAKKTFALPLSQVIAQQVEENEIAIQMKLFEEMETTEKMQKQQQEQQLKRKKQAKQSTPPTNNVKKGKEPQQTAQSKPKK